MSPQSLLARLSQPDPPVVLDVRSAAEFARGHVPGALRVPFYRAARAAAALGITTEDDVVVYCGHGPRARIATSSLRRRGFSHVSLLDGHWTGWQHAGLPVESSSELHPKSVDRSSP